MAKLVGSMPFWIDTITVDQRNPAEVIAAVQSIPAIFRDACRTLVLRERGSVQDCCIRAIASASDWVDLRRDFVEHTQTHFGMRCFDSYLERLWTFQEVLLSSTLDFVFYGPCSTRKPGKRAGQLYDDQMTQSTARSYLDTLFILGRAFCGNSGTTEKFVKAYIMGDQIKRSKTPPRTIQEDIYSDYFRDFHLASTRSATVPRDYVFATMPQFPWYHYPTQAAVMSFGDIFFDLFQQAVKADRPFVPRITRSMTDCKVASDNAWLPSLHFPEPKCLGDFLKLSGQPGITDPHFTTSVVIRSLDDECATDILDLVAQAMMFSPEFWRISDLAPEISRFGATPETGTSFDSKRDLFLNYRMEEKANDKMTQIETAIEQQYTSRTSDGTAIDQGDQLDPKNIANKDIQCSVNWQTEDHGFYKVHQDIDSHSEASSSASTETRERFENRLSEYHDKSIRALRRTRTWQLQEAHRVLTWLWKCFDARGTPNGPDIEDIIFDLLKDATPSFLRVMLLLTSMIGCQIPLSAASWTEEHFIPVRVNFGTFDVLGLLARHAWNSSCVEGVIMCSYGRHTWSGKGGLDLTINDPATKAPVGLLLDFYHLPRQLKHVQDKIDALYHQSDELGQKEGRFKLVVL